MTKQKSTKGPVGKPRRKADSESKAIAPKVNQPREELCVFAFRLTEEERDAIHKAAGPAKASRFARTLLVAAARNDAGAVKAIMETIRTAR